MSEETGEKVARDDVLRMAVDIVAAYVSQNQTSKGQLPNVIETVFNSLTEVSNEAATGGREAQKPAVSVRRSVTPEYIVCLEDGKKMKMLKRHLRTTYNLTPEEYRAKWNLPLDYPMVSPNYAKRRSEFAKNIGLGKKGGKGSKRRAQAK